MTRTRFIMVLVAGIAAFALYGCGSGYLSEWPTELEEEAGCQPGEIVELVVGAELGGGSDANSVEKFVIDDGSSSIDIDSDFICTEAAVTSRSISVVSATLMNELDEIYSLPYCSIGGGTCTGLDEYIAIDYDVENNEYDIYCRVRCERFAGDAEVHMVVNAQLDSEVTITELGDGTGLFSNAYLAVSRDVLNGGLSLAIDSDKVTTNYTSDAPTLVGSAMTRDEWNAAYPEFYAAMAGYEYLLAGDTSTWHKYDQQIDDHCWDPPTCSDVGPALIDGEVGTQVVTHSSITTKDWDLHTLTDMNIDIDASLLQQGINVVGNYTIFAKERVTFDMDPVDLVEELFIPDVLTDEFLVNEVFGTRG